MLLLLGHNTITVFVPTWRKELPRPDSPLTGEETRIAQPSRQMALIRQIGDSSAMQMLLSQAETMSLTSLEASRGK